MKPEDAAARASASAAVAAATQHGSLGGNGLRSDIGCGGPENHKEFEDGKLVGGLEHEFYFSIGNKHPN